MLGMLSRAQHLSILILMVAGGGGALKVDLGLHGDTAPKNNSKTGTLLVVTLYCISPPWKRPSNSMPLRMLR